MRHFVAIFLCFFLVSCTSIDAVMKLRHKQRIVYTYTPVHVEKVEKKKKPLPVIPAVIFRVPRIHITPPYCGIDVGQYASLGVVCEDKRGIVQCIDGFLWKTEDLDIVNLSEDGKIFGRSGGRAHLLVSCRAHGLNGEATIDVYSLSP